MNFSISRLRSWDDVSFIFDGLPNAVLKPKKIIGLTATKARIAQLLLDYADLAPLRSDLNLISNGSLTASIADFEWHPYLELDFDSFFGMTAGGDFAKASATRQCGPHIVLQTIAKKAEYVEQR